MDDSSASKTTGYGSVSIKFYFPWTFPGGYNVKYGLYDLVKYDLTKNAPEERQSYAISTYLLILDIALGFGPAFLGLFATTGHYDNLFLMSAMITIIALPVCIIVLKRMK